MISGYKSFSRGGAGNQPALAINQNLRDGLGLLLQAYQYALDAKEPIWDFALEIDKLYEVGVSISDLRWLVARGFIMHGRERPAPEDAHRQFDTGLGLKFFPSTGLILTDDGAAFTLGLAANDLSEDVRLTSNVDAVMDAESMQVAESNPLAGASQVIPNWDANRRELRLADLTVKRFRVPARNQELILSAFEEEGWPSHIDDPLPSSRDIDPQTRLHDAINRLNGRQENALLRFHGNGKGTGICWEVCQECVLPQRP